MSKKFPLMFWSSCRVCVDLKIVKFLSVKKLDQIKSNTAQHMSVLLVSYHKVSVKPFALAGFSTAETWLFLRV